MVAGSTAGIQIEEVARSLEWNPVRYRLFQFISWNWAGQHCGLGSCWTPFGAINCPVACNCSGACCRCLRGDGVVDRDYYSVICKVRRCTRLFPPPQPGLRTKGSKRSGRIANLFLNICILSCGCVHLHRVHFFSTISRWRRTAGRYRGDFPLRIHRSSLLARW